VSGKLLPSEIDEADHGGTQSLAAVETNAAIDEAIV
jgi:hypothetical protein